MSTASFDELKTALDSGGVDALLNQLVSRLTESGKFHELFEARKMQVRHRLGLPLMYSDAGDDLTDEQQVQLEEGLLAACREVGTALLKRGQIHSGWMYLRPVGDKPAAAALLDQVEVDEDNVEEFIEVALHEGVNPQRGFSAVLEHYGTCNAITTFETAFQSRTKGEQQAAAAQLVKHLHEELLATLKADAAQQEGGDPQEKTIRELVEPRDWLFTDGSYHIDTTHLASTVRFARSVDDPQILRLALDLTEYGRRLHDSFQYQGEAPFGDIYPSHALFFQALLGENVDEALAFFREKAESADAAQEGTVAAEVYVSLLSRVNRQREAIEEWIRLIPPGAQTLGYAPSLFDLARQARDYQRLIEYCQQHDDLLGYATSLVESHLSSQA